MSMWRTEDIPYGREMRRADLADIQELAALDRFLQWDLATVNPWGVPSLAATGARLLPHAGEVWTSTTVGFQAKVRNIRLHPRVALLRYHGSGPPVLLRGEAEALEGDGTDNLAALFRLMGGQEGSRRLFYESTVDSRWRRLYREYWRRILIRVRVVEVGLFTPRGLALYRVSEWAAPAAPAPRTPPAAPRRSTIGGALDRRGRQMLQDGVASVLAVPGGIGGAPLFCPAQVRQDRRGRILVHEQPGLGRGALPRVSLAVRVVDDTYELAREVAWIGRLQPGEGWREFVPRSTYGFTKPPGVIPDLAAGLAARVASGRLQGAGRVTVPEVEPAARRAGLARARPLLLSGASWSALEDLFSGSNAIAPWYAGWALLVREPALRTRLNYLANRAELERDWAQSLLIRGCHRVSPVRQAAAALRLRPRSADPLMESRRHDRILERSRQVLRRELPESLRAGVVPPLRTLAPPLGSMPFELAAVDALRSTAVAGAAALDRLLRRN